MCVYFYRATAWMAPIARARAAHDGARAIDRDGRVVRARDGRERDGRDGNRTNRRERRKGKERKDRIESNRIESNRIATETRRKGDERSTAAMVRATGRARAERGTREARARRRESSEGGSRDEDAAATTATTSGRETGARETETAARTREGNDEEGRAGVEGEETAGRDGEEEGRGGDGDAREGDALTGEELDVLKANTTGTKHVRGMGMNGHVMLEATTSSGDGRGGDQPPAKARKIVAAPKGLGPHAMKNVPSSVLDESERKLRRPKVQTHEVYGLLRAHYDLGDIDRESLKELPSYDDKNWYFCAYTDDPKTGEKVKHEYVAKVHNGMDSSGVSRGVLAAQERIIGYLAAHGVEVPNVVKSKLAMYTTPGPNGTVNLVSEGTPGAKREFCTRVTFLASNQVAHTMRVLTYVRGKTIVQVPMPHSIDFVRRSGLFVGQVCHALSKWPTPKEMEIQQDRRELGDAVTLPYVEQHAMCWKVLTSRSRLWDLRFFMDVQHFMTDLIMRELFEDETRIMMCNTVFNAFKHLVLPVADKLRIGILHNDLNEQNIIALESGPDPVKFPANVKFAAIDFGDVVVSWRVNEIAVACAYCALDKEDPVHDMSMMLAGIQSVYPLTPLEMRVLPCLIAARLVTSLIMGMYSYHMQIVGEQNDHASDAAAGQANSNADPSGEPASADTPRGNVYVLTTQKSAWTALTRILTVGAETMFKRFIIDAYSEGSSVVVPQAAGYPA
jgi:hydroxylysine kinase